LIHILRQPNVVSEIWTKSNSCSTQGLIWIFRLARLKASSQSERTGLSKADAGPEQDPVSNCKLLMRDIAMIEQLGSRRKPFISLSCILFSQLELILFMNTIIDEPAYSRSMVNKPLKDS
jgi:hypothetical protein